jgi:hypothetical protein
VGAQSGVTTPFACRFAQKSRKDHRIFRKSRKWLVAPRCGRKGDPGREKRIAPDPVGLHIRAENLQNKVKN